MPRTVTAPSTVPLRRARTRANPETATVQIPGALVMTTADPPPIGVTGRLYQSLPLSEASK